MITKKSDLPALVLNDVFLSESFSKITMEQFSFSEILDALNQLSSFKEKKAVTQNAAETDTFTCSQAAQILDEFPFSKEKLQTLEILRPQISDIGNSFQFMDKFTFVKDKKKASTLLGQPPKVEAAPSGEMPAVIEASALSKLLEALGQQKFPKEQLYLIELAIFRNAFTSAQVVQLLQTFQFSRHKLRALKIIRYRIIDPENFFLILSAFDRHLDKKRVTELLTQKSDDINVQKNNSPPES